MNTGTQHVIEFTVFMLVIVVGLCIKVRNDRLAAK